MCHFPSILFFEPFPERICDVKNWKFDTIKCVRLDNDENKIRSWGIHSHQFERKSATAT